MNSRLGLWVARRTMSTGTGSGNSIIPPNVSNLREIGKLSSKYPQAHPDLFAKMKSFYSKIAKGPAPAANSEEAGFFARYYDKYIATDSPKPLLHLLGVLIPLGYYISYFKGGHYHPTREFH